MNNIVFKFIFSILTFVLFLNGCNTQNSNEQASKFVPFKDGEKIELKGVGAQSIVLVRKDGGFILESDPKKIIMFDIFGTFCPPCQREAPALMQYQLNNADKFMLIGLTHFENVTNDYVLSEFVQKYNAYYFISNDIKINDRLAEQIVTDIGYKHEIALPLKVVLKDTKYQQLTDVDSGRYGVYYYLGGINLNDIKKDLNKIYENTK